MKATIIGGTITLYTYTDWATKERVEKVAVIPSKDWEGARINLLHWEFQGENKVMLRYTMSDSLNAAINVSVFDVETDRYLLEPPSRSKNWKLNEFMGEWQNSRTGERVAVQ